jgi:sterol desaturase/sphingolipid hydroxylase (fatty acid hydroxylase superfamily)
MAKPVLQTRQIGLRTHFSGHPLAPMEIVYEVEKPKTFWQRWNMLGVKKQFVLILTLVSIVALAAMLGGALIDVFGDGVQDGDITWLAVAVGCGLASYIFRER